MKRNLIITLIVILFIFTSASADVYVNGYYRGNGTYVQPHYRSNPNSTSNDNWSTKGNINPYTSQPGYKNPTNPYQQNSWR